MTSRQRRQQRGFALVSVLLLTTMVILTAGLVLMPSIMGRDASIRSGSNLEAANCTEAALDFGMAALNSLVPSGNSASLGTMPGSFRQGTGTGANTWTYNDAANNNFFRNTFDATPVLTVRIPASVPIPGGTGVAADYRIIRASATIDGAQKTMEAIVRVRTTTVESPINPFPRAITARGDIDPNGNAGTLRTDSYDSALGPYGGANVGNLGGVHTNGNLVDGGVYRGNVSAVGTISPAVSVQGTGNTIRAGAGVESIPDPPPMPTPTTSVAVSPPQTVTPASGAVVNLGAVSMSGNASKVLTLNAGTYVMSSLSTTGNASIRIGTGPVTIYVNGDIDIMGNGIVNASALPPNLRMIVSNPAARISIAGNGDFHGALQAPNNAVTLGGNGTFYGAVVANTFGFNGSNSAVHYDAALGRAFTTPSQVTRPSDWQTLAINVLDRNQ